MDKIASQCNPTSAPGVGVVVVNYNGGTQVSDQLTWLVGSDAVSALVIVDNRSTDNSLAGLDRLASEFPKVQLIRNPQNVGFSAAVNQAAKQLKQDYLLLLNPDCRPEPGAIEILAGFLEARPDAGLVGGLVLNSDGSEQRGARRHIPTPCSALGELPLLSRWIRGFNLVDEPLPRTPSRVGAVSGAFMLVRRSLLEKLGGMDESYFLHFEDIDVCVRVAEPGYGVWFHPLAVATHAKGVSSSSRPMLVHWHKHLSMWQFFRRQAQGRPGSRLGAFILTWARFSMLLPGVLWRWLTRWRRP